ncbi:MAG: family 20 glycosylhydrolase [Lachnospiraceae bacterium]|nr:family 20 glycosylhydrolase [Lachnospiraceae bacterium]
MGGTGDRYGFRAFHIDCSRHFFAVPELKKMIAAAAEFGFNYFHWHISDDQGYRLESRRFPRLHEISSVRKGDHFAYYFSDRPEGGYYTFEDVREVLECCDSHGIEVIPELDVPGHVSAILAAYPELSCSGEETEVVTSGGIFHGIFCPAKEEVYAFLEALLGELIGLFPGEYFHIGGDEVPHENWENCPLCREKILGTAAAFLAGCKNLLDIHLLSFKDVRPLAAAFYHGDYMKPQMYDFLDLLRIGKPAVEQDIFGLVASFQCSLKKFHHDSSSFLAGLESAFSCKRPSVHSPTGTENILLFG